MCGRFCCYIYSAGEHRSGQLALGPVVERPDLTVSIYIMHLRFNTSKWENMASPTAHLEEDTGTRHTFIMRNLCDRTLPRATRCASRLHMEGLQNEGGSLQDCPPRDSLSARTGEHTQPPGSPKKRTQPERSGTEILFFGGPIILSPTFVNGRGIVDRGSPS